uniref:Larval cuticle protein 8 n=1 Tax=Megaselia scalaris TaxID=36166 RepID=T1H4J9_MEGSC
MKFAIVFAALFALAIAGPVSHGEADVVRSDVEVGPESHSYTVETSDGTKLESSGHLENAGTDNEAYVVKGSYTFFAEDGSTHTVNYVADENGYQPQSADLPVAPVA